MKNDNNCNSNEYLLHIVLVVLINTWIIYDNPIVLRVGSFVGCIGSVNS